MNLDDLPARSQMFKIEKGIPPPADTRPRPPVSVKGLMREMAVGDSFVAPKRPAGSQLEGLSPRKFSTRKVDGGFRVWRTA